MSREFQSRIFEPFAREDSARVDKEAGAGMGLAITKHIVDTMGGTIEVESEQGVGTQFHITLDMELASGQEKELHLSRRDVLVVDDDKTACDLAVAALESIGLYADGAPDVESALQMLERQSYHLLLLDHDIQGQDGVHAAKELSGRFGPELPVILLTDGEWDELEARAEGTIVSGFISKPLFRSSLYYGLRPFIEATAPQQEQQGEAVVDLTGTRILVAEDNELNWEIADEMLSEYGLELEWAENGQICVEKFEASAPGWYGAILMDLRMPVMTGFEATVAIRKLDREDARSIPIIAVSADAFQDDIQKCLDCGMNAHTAKPLDPEKILALLGKYLRQNNG